MLLSTIEWLLVPLYLRTLTCGLFCSWLQSFIGVAQLTHPCFSANVVFNTRSSFTISNCTSCAYSLENKICCLEHLGNRRRGKFSSMVLFFLGHHLRAKVTTLAKQKPCASSNIQDAVWTHAINPHLSLKSPGDSQRDFCLMERILATVTFNWCIQGLIFAFLAVICSRRKLCGGLRTAFG